MADETDDLLDYDEDVEVDPKAVADKNAGAQKKDNVQIKQGSYVGIHSSGFKDFLLKPELMRAVVDCGFEHPSQVQFECVPQAILGMDIICQAKSGMGKTAVFVLATLHQLEPKQGEISVVVLCHTRELAFQIHNEYKRFTKYLSNVTSAVFYGGVPVNEHRKMLTEKETVPNIVIGTPGRMVHLSVKEKTMNLSGVKHFVLDECDKMLDETDMRRDVQSIFTQTPHDKQVMMFSATLAKEVRPICKKFCQEAMELYVDDEAKLTLHGLQQYYVKLEEKEKNRKLNDLLDSLEFNQVIIFVSKVTRAIELNKLLVECSFPSIVTHSRMKQAERIAQLEKFKNFDARILVSTDLLGRGIDIERVNIVVNYDFPDGTDSYLHRVNRAGRFGTRGLALSFVSGEDDEKVLEAVQQRFEVKIQPMPDTIDVSTYMNA